MYISYKIITKRIALIGAILLILIAIFADFIASSYPIILHWKGKTFWFSNIILYDELRFFDNAMIIKNMKQGDWGIFPVVPFGPSQSKVNGSINPLNAPNIDHLLGTDDRGRDVLARLIHGTRASLIVGLGSVFLYCFFGIFIGGICGYYGGLIDKVFTRLTEVILSFPTFFLILAIQGLLTKTSLLQLILVIGFTRWTDVARLIRAEVIKIKVSTYVEAARAIGVSESVILWNHILPNAIYPLFVSLAFGISGSILIESSLSFLGFGVPLSTPSWGELLTQGYNYPQNWWLIVFPGIEIFLTLIIFNLLGEYIKEKI